MTVAPADANVIPVVTAPPGIRVWGPKVRVFRVWALGLQRGLECGLECGLG
ncbi:MAG: hypothetical protein JO281_01370 [Pseudonocardiales bacterium]|nr:hypothetical protein [Pseudonocardiales bacterium]